MNEIKIYPSPNNEQKRMFKSKTQNHFNNTNNSKILKQFYSKEFPIKIKTNDILKLMLFLNEYIINNNLLDDYYIKEEEKKEEKEEDKESEVMMLRDMLTYREGEEGA